MPDVINIVEDHLAKNKWMIGDEFTLFDCAYGPTFNVIEKAGFSFSLFPRVNAYMDGLRARPAWNETPKLPGL